MQCQGIEDKASGQPVWVGLKNKKGDLYSLGRPYQAPGLGRDIRTHYLINNSTAKKKSFLPFMLYMEASEYPLLNRTMRAKQKANTSDREHP